MFQFGASLTDNTSIVIYDRIVFMIQATGVSLTDDANRYIYDRNMFMMQATHEVRFETKC